MKLTNKEAQKIIDHSHRKQMILDAQKECEKEKKKCNAPSVTHK